MEEVVCVLLAATNATSCFGNLAGLVPPTSLGNDVAQLGYNSAYNSLWAWRDDGSLLGWTDGVERMLPPSVNGNRSMQWSSFGATEPYVTSTSEISLFCGVLRADRGAVCIPMETGSLLPSCMDLRTPEQVLSQLNDALDPQFRSIRFTEFLPIAPIDLSSPRECIVNNACGLLNNGLAVCFGAPWPHVPGFNVTLGVAVLPMAGRVRLLALEPEGTDGVTAWICIATDEHVACYAFVGHQGTTNWSLQATFTSALPSPLVQLVVSYDVAYGVTSGDERVIDWILIAPAEPNPQFPVPSMPTIALQTAPQFHYREKAGPLTPCPLGTYSLGAGSMTPLCSGKCPAGRYGNSSSADSLCSGACPPGHYCPVGSVSPLPCAAGNFGAKSGLVDSGCTGGCLPGYYCPEASTRPDTFPCAPGEASSHPEQPCQRCGLNSYSGAPASAECTPCPAGTFAPAEGMSACLACASSGMECGLGSASIEFGYWAVLGNFSAHALADTEQLGPYLCPPGYCDGEEAVGGSASNGTAEAVRAALNNPCSAHRSVAADNPLCGRCEESYWEWNGVCSSCPAMNGVLLFGLLALAFAVAGVLHLLSRRSVSTARLSILVYFAQTVLLLMRAKGGSELSKVFAWLHVFNLSWLQPTGSHCLARLNAQQQIWLDAWTPITLLLPLLVFAALQWLWRRSRKLRVGAAFPSHEYIRTSITILLLSFQQLCVGMLAYLQCVNVGPYRVVFSAPSIDCSSSGYRSLQALAICLLLLAGGGAPLMLLRFLHRHRKLIQAELGNGADAFVAPLPRTESQLLVFDHAAAAVGHESAPGRWQEQGSQPQPDDVYAALLDEFGEPAAGPFRSFSLHYSALYSAFRSGCYLWLPVLLLRRLALIAIAVLLLSQSDWQGLLFNTLCLAILLLHTQMRPYRDPTDNRLEALSLGALTLLSFTLSSQPARVDAELSTGAQVLAGVLLAAPLLLLIAAVAQQACARLKPCRARPDKEAPKQVRL